MSYILVLNIHHAGACILIISKLSNPAERVHGRSGAENRIAPCDVNLRRANCYRIDTGDRLIGSVVDCLGPLIQRINAGRRPPCRVIDSGRAFSQRIDDGHRPIEDLADCRRNGSRWTLRTNLTARSTYRNSRLYAAPLAEIDSLRFHTFSR